MTGSGPRQSASIGTSAGSGELTSFLPVQGLVSGGQSRAVVGAKVYLLQVTAIGGDSAPVSLLTAATGNPPDSIGYYVRSGEFGGFSIAGDYICSPGRQVYVLARGGNSGADGLNPAIGLMASLGVCPEQGTFAKTVPFAVVNAVTTVATAYAMAGNASDAIRADNSADLVNVATGQANVMAPGMEGRAVPRAKIHTLANILSSCINSDSATSLNCTALFANARSMGESGLIPTDTAAAAINIARHVRANVATLYALQPPAARPFEPALEQVPPDFKLSLGGRVAGTSLARLERP